MYDYDDVSHKTVAAPLQRSLSDEETAPPLATPGLADAGKKSAEPAPIQGKFKWWKKLIGKAEPAWTENKAYRESEPQWEISPAYSVSEPEEEDEPAEETEAITVPTLAEALRNAPKFWGSNSAKYNLVTEKTSLVTQCLNKRVTQANYRDVRQEAILESIHK